MRKLLLLVSFAFAGLTFAGTAAGADPTASTVVNTSFSETLTATNPCTADSGAVLLTGTEIAHATDFGGGVFFVTTVDLGTLTFTDSVTGQTLTGRFASTFSFESTPPGLQFDVTNLFNTVATAADGSKVQYQLRIHRTRTPQAEYVVSFMVVSATCVSPGG
jgi:hypothetical protein